MGFTDIFKGNQYKSELEDLQQKYNDLQSLMTPEMQNAFSLQNKIRELESSIQESQKTITVLTQTISEKGATIAKLNAEIDNKKSQIIYLDDEIMVQEFGLYKPQFSFANALDYKEKLAEIRATQKFLIKDKRAVLGNTNWQVNGSYSKGKKWFQTLKNYYYALSIQNATNLLQK